MWRVAIAGNEAALAARLKLAPRLRHARLTAVGVVNPAQIAAMEGLPPGIATGMEARSLLREHPDAFDAMVLAAGTGSADALAAIAAGKHILWEEALGASRQEIQDLASAGRGKSVAVMVGQSLRYVAAAQVARSALDDGKLGAPGLLRIHRWRPRREESPGDPGTDSSDSMPPAAAILGCLGSEIDLACWLMGGPPEVVFAQGTVPSGGLADTLPYLQLHLGFSGGGMALIDFASTLPRGEGYFSLSLIGASGAVYADDHRNKHLLFAGGTPAALGSADPQLAGLRQWQAFIDCLTSKHDVSHSCEELLQAQAVAEAAADSLAVRQAVSPRRRP